MIDRPSPRLGIITTGKAYLDVRQALDDLGIDEREAARLGIRLYKVGLTWPLETSGARRFAEGLQDVLVVEEKRGLIEDQLDQLLYNTRGVAPAERGRQARRDRPRRCCRARASSPPPWWRARIVQRLKRLGEREPAVQPAPGAARSAGAHAATRRSTKTERLPFFCSGCPHNTSTRVPEGSRAGAGIGCHAMAIWMPARRTAT